MKTPDQLDVDIDQDLPTNHEHQITPQVFRDLLKEIVANFGGAETLAVATGDEALTDRLHALTPAALVALQLTPTGQSTSDTLLSLLGELFTRFGLAVATGFESVSDTSHVLTPAALLALLNNAQKSSGNLSVGQLWLNGNSADGYVIMIKGTNP